MRERGRVEGDGQNSRYNTLFDFATSFLFLSITVGIVYSSAWGSGLHKFACHDVSCLFFRAFFRMWKATQFARPQGLITPFLPFHSFFFYLYIFRSIHSCGSVCVLACSFHCASLHIHGSHHLFFVFGFKDRK